MKLEVKDLIGDYRCATPDEIIAEAIAAINRRFRRGSCIQSPATSRDYFVLKLSERQHEVFAALFLDNRHRVIGYEELFMGSIDGASVHPRVVAQKALAQNAAALIFAHNHPSGVAEPSKADEQITRRLKEALALLDVRVLDHIVVGGSETVSLAERGLL